MTSQSSVPKKPLILAMLCGLCADASWAGLIHSAVPFSFFPLIALVLAGNQLLQYYRQYAIAGSAASCMVLSFFIGLFGHSALVKVQYPELGSNFFSLIMTLLLLAALSMKLSKSIAKDHPE